MHSHVHALGQCRKVIREHGLRPVISGDTAGAAREVAESGDLTQAAISPPLAAETYGLEILAPDVEDEEHNTTRFVVLSRELVEAPRRQRARSSPASSSTCATCRPRSTRRSAASRPTA